jgi:ADP-ribose pyrophosphatase
VVDLGWELVTLPDGTCLELEMVRHPGGAAVAAVDGRQRVCLIRHYRHAAGGWLWELPAGKRETGEAPERTARRELREETGIEAGSWVDLGALFTTPGFCDEVIHLFLARDLEVMAPAHQSDELIEVHWLPLTEALDWALRGRIQDAKTLSGLCRCYHRLHEELPVTAPTTERSKTETP